VALRRSIQGPPDAPFRLALGPAQFFLDDIRDVYDALIDLSKRHAESSGQTDSLGKVEIRALSATADDIEDLKEATRAELDNVILVLSAPKIRVDLRDRSAGIIAETESTMIRSFAESLRDFARSRRNWRAYMQRRMVIALGPLYFLVAASYFLPLTPESWGFGTNRGIGKYHLELSLFFSLATLGVTRFFYLGLRNHIKVIPAWRKEHRGLSSQTRTAIIVGVASALVAGVLGLWAGVFVHK
jgi:hypothetical protein